MMAEKVFIEINKWMQSDVQFLLTLKEVYSRPEDTIIHMYDENRAGRLYPVCILGLIYSTFFLLLPWEMAEAERLVFTSVLFN